MEKRNMVGKRKIKNYTEGECDAVIIRLENNGQGSGKYYDEVVAQRQALMDKASARARRVREQSKVA